MIKRLLPASLSARPATAVQLAAPGAFFLLFAAVPLVLLVAYSFFRAGFFEVEPALTLDSYDQIVSDPLYQEVLLRTVVMAALVATATVAIAYPFAYFATFAFPRRRDLLIFLVIASLFTGYLVRIFAWRTILGREGLINSALTSLGVVDEPLRFLVYSRFAVCVVLIGILLPFAILPIYAAMQNVPRDLLESSRDLGSSRIATIRTVILPLTQSGAVTALAFCFLLAAGDYVTPTLVGGTDGLMVGNLIADQFGASDNLPLGAALGVTVIAVGAAFVAVGKGVLRLVTTC